TDRTKWTARIPTPSIPSSPPFRRPRPIPRGCTPTCSGSRIRSCLWATSHSSLRIEIGERALQLLACAVQARPDRARLEPEHLADLDAVQPFDVVQLERELGVERQRLQRRA